MQVTQRRQSKFRILLGLDSWSCVQPDDDADGRLRCVPHDKSSLEMRATTAALIGCMTRQAWPFTLCFSDSVPFRTAATCQDISLSSGILRSITCTPCEGIGEPLTAPVYLELTLADQSAKLGSLAFHTQHEQHR